MSFDNPDPVTHWLKLGLNTVLPLTVVAVSLAARLLPPPGERVVFGDILSEEDLKSEVEPKIDSEDLEQHLTSRRSLVQRNLKSLVYAVINAAELADSIALLVHAIDYSHSEIVPRTLGVLVWLYATVASLTASSTRPAYSLLAIYLLYLGDAALEILLDLLDGNLHFTRVFFVTRVAGCLLGALLALNTPLRPSIPGADTDAPELEDRATLGEWLAVTWLQPLIDRARRGSLEHSDIWQLAAECRSRILTTKFIPLWPEKSLMSRILLANSGDLALWAFATMLDAVLVSVQPILLRRILAAIESAPAAHDNMLDISFSMSPQLPLISLLTAPFEVATRDARSAYLYTFIAFVLLVFRANVSVVSQLYHRRFTVRTRAEVTGSICTKALVRIDTSGIVRSAGEEQPNKADIGKVISLVNVDIGRLGMLPNILTAVFASPVRIAISAYFLFDVLGLGGFVGYTMLFVATPFTAWLMGKMMKQIGAVSEQRDIRTSAVHELLQSAKFIKFSGWETRWIDRIMELRKAELAEQFKFLAIEAVAELIWEVVPILIACISLAWFTLVSGHELTVATAFPAILALSQLTDDINSWPQQLGMWTMVKMAVKRIDAFLHEDEVPAWVSSLKHNTGAEATGSQFDSRLGAIDATFQWHTNGPVTSTTPEGNPIKPPSLPWYRRWFSKASTTPQSQSQALQSPAPEREPVFQLRDINVVFPRGRLSVVSGPTGSGKSSLLAALLGEMDRVSGTVLLPKTTHRVDSEIGLVEGVSFCAQHPWLESKTIKQNILFGSAYDSERYKAVLDACALEVDLRQLDSGDETEIGDRGVVLSGGQKARIALARAVYARTKTVLLDDILSAVDSHTAAVLIHKCLFGPLMHGRTVVLVTHHLAAVTAQAGWIAQMNNGRIVAQGTQQDLRAAGLLSELLKPAAPPVTEVEHVKGQEDNGSVVATAPKKLVEPETKATGSVRLAVYATYLSAASYWIFALFALSLLVQQSSSLAEKFWIKVWVESYDRPVGWKGPFGFPSASIHVYPYVLVYLGLQLSTVVLVIAAIFPAIWSAIRASRILFHKMLDSVLRSPTRWFDSTPVGRTLARFSKDIDCADADIQYGFQHVGTAFISFVVASGTIVYGVPPFAAPLVLIVWLHLYVARGYITASRDLGRLQSTTRSPVVTLFGEMLQGLVTIRAFNAETKFMDAMYKVLDTFHWTLYYSGVCDVWLRYRFNTLGAFTFGISAFLALRLGISPGLAAIVLVQAQNMLVKLFDGMKIYTMLETAMSSVERIYEMIELPPEAPRHMHGIPASWPLLGEGIVFDNVVLRYAANLDPVLRGVSLRIKAGEKIGIVGRTGSGKSTLAMSLFRFVDPESGRIIVGGRDITRVGVQDLRERLTLIPQDAVLYNGTIRENLDPFSQHTDAECTEALRMVHLPVDAVEATTSAEPAMIITLESKVSDGGANWSAGQRQLIAMARALLRNTGVIVLDESTASVDLKTDQKIQNTIREQFKGNILLTIAHRLNTIIDYDRVIVLDAGQVVEFDSPAVLIAKEGGAFRGLCLQSGNFEDLERAALEKMIPFV